MESIEKIVFNPRIFYTMYAVVEIGGRQYRVAEGDLLFVDKQHAEDGESLTFDRVLLINDGNGDINLGAPVVEGASVTATLVEQLKADKVIVFKKKRRKGYRKKKGHRQQLSQIKIETIATSSSSSKKKTKKADASKKTEAAPKKEEQSAVSTDLTAKEAIAHIENTPLDQLKGFVPDSEERVTVVRAWESKQEG